MNKCFYISNSYKIKKFNDNRKISYMNKNNFARQLNTLRKYFMRSYKYIIFNKDYTFSHDDGEHELLIPTEENFKKVYGQLKIIYYVSGEKVTIKNIEPEKILNECYKKDLKCYKGVPIRNEWDKFKIDMVLGGVKD